MTSSEVAAWQYPCAFREPLVGWEVCEEGQVPPPPGHSRIVLGPHLDWRKCTEPGEWLASLGGREAFLSACGPDDIVHVQLTASAILRPTSARHPDFDLHCELIRDLAPRVRGILVGNMACEFSENTAPDMEFGAAQARTAVELGRVVIRAGGRPYFGTTDWTLLDDCYTGGHLRNVMAAMGAVQVCFCGYSLSEACTFDRAQPLYARQRRFQVERDGVAPSPRLCEYLVSGEFWSDVDWLTGLEAGNDRELARMGFAAGAL